MTPEEKQARIDAIRAELARRGEDEDDSSTLGNFMTGIASPVVGTYFGLKDLMVGLDDEDEASMASWRKAQEEAGMAGTAGAIVGELATFLLPGGALRLGLKGAAKAGTALGGRLGSSVARGATRAADASRASGLTGDATAAATMGAIRAPEPGSTRLGNAAEGATAGVLGGLIGKGIGSVARGIKTSEPAQRLLDKGVELTPGQAASGTIPRMTEFVLSLTPTTARATKELRDRATKQAVNSLFDDVSRATGVAIKPLGRSGKLSEDAFNDLAGAFKQGYSGVWSTARKITMKDIADLEKFIARKRLNIVDEEGVKALEDVITKVKNTREELFRNRDVDVGDVLSQLDKNINSSVTPNTPITLIDALGVPEGVKGFLRERLLPDVSRARIRELDAAYPEYKAFKVARTAALGRKKVADRFVMPYDLTKAMLNVGSKGDQAVYGKGPLQGSLRDLDQTVARGEEPGVLMNFLRGIAQLAPGPQGAMSSMRGATFGQTAPQRILSQTLDTLERRPGAGATSLPRIASAYMLEDD